MGAETKVGLDKFLVHCHFPVVHTMLCHYPQEEVHSKMSIASGKV